MEKRIIRTGLVGSLQSDFESAGESFEANLKKRLRMLCVRPGPRYDDKTQLYFEDTKQISESVFQFAVSDVGLVVFPGFDFHCPDANQYLTDTVTVTEAGYWYILLHKVETNSDAGEFMPGYPENDDDYTMRTITVELVVTDHYERGADYIPLYKVYYDGESWSEVDDYRDDVCLLLSSDTNIVVGDLEITGLTSVIEDIADIQDAEAIYSEMEEVASFYPFNTLSHKTNALRNPSIMTVTWDAIDMDQTVWCYEIRVAPYVSGSPDYAHAMYDVVMANKGESTRSYTLQVIKTRHYSISVRAVSASLARIVGNWTTIEHGSEAPISLYTPATPALEAIGNYPKTYTLIPSYYAPDDVDAMAVRRTVNPSWGAAFKDIVHYGQYGPVIVTVPPYSNCTFATRMLLKNGQVTDWSAASTSISTEGPPAATPRSKQFSFPMNIKFTTSYYNDPIGRFLVPDLGDTAVKLVRVTLHAWGMARQKANVLEGIDIFLRQVGGPEYTIFEIDDDYIPSIDNVTSFYGANYEQTHITDGLDIIMTVGDAWSLRATPGASSPSGWAHACGMLVFDLEPYDITTES